MLRNAPHDSHEAMRRRSQARKVPGRTPVRNTTGRDGPRNTATAPASDSREEAPVAPATAKAEVVPSADLEPTGQHHHYCLRDLATSFGRCVLHGVALERESSCTAACRKTSVTWRASITCSGLEPKSEFHFEQPSGCGASTAAVRKSEFEERGIS